MAHGDPPRTQLPDRLDDVGPGWSRILLELHERLIAVAPAYELAEVKEKFGGLRVDVFAPTVQTTALILEAEDRASRTCESCGAPGHAREGSWIRTLCDRCADGRLPLEPRA